MNSKAQEALAALENCDARPAITFFVEQAKSHLAAFDTANDSERDAAIMERYPGLTQASIDLIRCSHLDAAGHSFMHAATLARLGSKGEYKKHLTAAAEAFGRGNELLPYQERVSVATAALQAIG